MQSIPKWEITSVLNARLYEVRKRRKIDRQIVLKMLRETEKYPLLVRVASELHRAGVDVRKFQREFQSDWSLTTRIAEELDRIDRGRNGYDPMRVPAILPIYLRPILAETGDVQSIIRPSKADASKQALEWVKSRLLRGWLESDVRRAIDSVLQSQSSDTSDVIVVSGASLEEAATEEPVVPRKVVRRYFVHDGSADWLVFDSPTAAKRAMNKLVTSVVANVTATVPMEEITARRCKSCGLPLNGQVLTIRTPVESAKGKSKKGKNKVSKYSSEHYHPNCYWLTCTPPPSIPFGMRLLRPQDAATMVWCGPELGGWRPKDEVDVTYDNSTGTVRIVVKKKPPQLEAQGVSGTNGGTGVSPTAGKERVGSTTVPIAPA